jgi:DNA-binding MarR family transcriptional regulator
MSEPSTVDTWELLIRFHRITTKAMDEQLRAKFGYSLDDYDILHQIHLHGAPIRMGELADRLLVANSSCNRIVARLVEAGLISRHHGAADRREVLVDLTTAGKRLRRRMAAVHTRDIEALVGKPLSTNQHNHLNDSLSRLLSRADT